MAKMAGLQMDVAGGSGVMGVDAFRDTIRGASQGQLNEHEIMSLARFYQVSYFYMNDEYTGTST